jgi:GT2 family glycosyltransferase/glycosyltransferase involved in cell wall biosynthesis
MYPSISVIIVNLNGQALLADCIDALAAQDYPQDRLEIILVDNGSTDDSVPLVRETYPTVRIIEAGRNLGFAGGNNLGARVATGDYLALINNDAYADSHWLRAMVEALEGQPEVACAASKILDQDGKTIDFVGPVMNLYGRAFQIDKGMPVVPGVYDEPRELLAPCGGAMMIRRDVFWQVGGFDEDYIAYYEDLDLGWRLWLYGYEVVFVPDAVVYHRQHQTGLRFPVEQRYVLSEANALRAVIKNLEEENLWRVLPFSLFMGVKRSLDQAMLDRERYGLGYPVPGDAQAGAVEPEPRMTRVATSFLVAIDQVADEMPRLLEKRRRIQAARVRSDEEIFARFPMRPDNWIFPWRRYHVVQDQLARELGVPDVLRPQHGSRLLIITHETIGPRMAGPGIRAWEMACALAGRFDVTLVAPGEPRRSHPELRVVGYETDNPYYPSLDPYINNTDVVLATGSLFAKVPRLRDLSKPAIVDLYDPFELEKLAQSPTVEEQYHVTIDVESIVHLRLEGAIGDFFICASERQRDFWLGALLAAGRVNTVTYAQDPTLRRLIDVVPFGIPPEPPRKQCNVLKGVRPGIGSEDKVLLWNGGLWQWFDPLTLVDALVEVLRVRDDVRLFFAAGRHFNLETVPEMPIYAQTVARCRELGLLDRHVFFGDWIPYDERGEYLLEADLGVSIHRPNLESRFASRTRLLDCIWAGLPVLSTAGDPVSDMIAGRGLGQIVPSERPDRLAEAILSMLADDGLRVHVTKNAQTVWAELAWERVVEPIAAFLEHVAFAPDALTASRTAAEARRTVERLSQLESRVQHLVQECGRLMDHLNDIRQGRVMRVLNILDNWLSKLEGRE